MVAFLRSASRASLLALLLVGCANDIDGDAEDEGSVSSAERKPTKYAGNLEQVFCDVKRPLAHASPDQVTNKNYEAILDGFAKLGCNGIRMPILTVGEDPNPLPLALAKYPALYDTFLAEARKRGFVIYANPLGTGDFGFEKTTDDAAYAAWIADYANKYQVRFVGPFNESGPLGTSRMLHITSLVRKALDYGGTLVGPDSQHVDTSAAQLDAGLLDNVGIAGAHNAVGDDGATTAGWNAFVKAANGKRAWATENPRPWSSDSAKGQEVGVKAVVASKVTGLVLYLAYPAHVNEDGTLTDKGAAIAKGIRK